MILPGILCVSVLKLDHYRSGSFRFRRGRRSHHRQADGRRSAPATTQTQAADRLELVRVLMLCDYSNPDRLELVDRPGQSEDRNVPGSVVVCLERAFDESSPPQPPSLPAETQNCTRGGTWQNCGASLREYVVSARHRYRLSVSDAVPHARRMPKRIDSNPIAL